MPIDAIQPQQADTALPNIRSKGKAGNLIEDDFMDDLDNMLADNKPLNKNVYNQAQ